MSESITEIIKLVDAKVSAAVIKAFIQNATMAYNPTAAELIALKEHGAEADIMLALLQRGAELMARTPQTQTPVQSWVYAPVHNYESQTESVTTTEGYSDSGTASAPADASGVSDGATVIYGGLPGYPGGHRPGNPPHPPHPPRRDGGGVGGNPGVGQPGPPAPPASAGPSPGKPGGAGGHPGGAPSGGHSGGSSGGRPR
jgi:uncharacterized membrane protein YgcG